MTGSADTTVILIECPSCEKGIQKTVTRLVEIDILPCPICRGMVNLNDPQLAGVIKKAAEDCAAADAAASKTD